MKILHLIRGLANSSGTTHIVGPLAEQQALLGHEVEVLFVDKPGEAPVTPDTNLVKSRRFPMTVSSRHFGWSRAFTQALPDHLRHAEIVHIHAIWNYVTWCGMQQAWRHGVPYVVAPQGSFEDWALGRSRRLKRLYARFTESPLFDRAAAMQALTEAEAEQIRNFGIRTPSVVLPNGVHLAAIDEFLQADHSLADDGVHADHVRIIFLSRLFPKKGLDLLIPAFQQVAERHPHATLLIAGHDAGMGYRAVLEQLACDCNVDHRIRFLGELRGADKFRTLSRCDLFVLPSYSEGLPVAALEAMACRLPVVVTQGCHLPEVPQREAGWEVEATVTSLVDGLEQALADADERRRRAANARQLVEEKFDWPQIAAASINIYEQLLAGDTRSRISATTGVPV